MGLVAEMPPLVPLVARLTEAEAGVMSLGGRAGHQGCGRLGAVHRCRGESGLGEARMLSGSTAGTGASENTVSTQFRPPSVGLGAPWPWTMGLLGASPTGWLAGWVAWGAPACPAAP